LTTEQRRTPAEKRKAQVLRWNSIESDKHIEEILGFEPKPKAFIRPGL